MQLDFDLQLQQIRFALTIFVRMRDTVHKATRQAAQFFRRDNLTFQDRGETISREIECPPFTPIQTSPNPKPMHFLQPTVGLGAEESFLYLLVPSFVRGR